MCVCVHACAQKHSKTAAVYKEEQCVRKRGTCVIGVGPLNVSGVNMIWGQGALFAADVPSDWLL